MFEINGYTITLTRGDSASIQLIPTVLATGAAYVFQSGDAVKFRIRQLPECGAVVELDGYINLENNTCVVTVHPEDTWDLMMTEYRYEAELQASDGGRYTFIADQKFIIGKELENHG